MKVTIAIPVYNVENYIERALNSALNQTFTSIEYLLIDDKGTDNSIDIVRNIIREHPQGKNARIIEHNTNKGIGAVRNTAIDNARGDYFYFMDSDDEITPDCIRLLYEKMMETQADFVSASVKVIFPDGTIDRKWCLNFPDKYIKRAEYAVAKAYYSKEISEVYICNTLYNTAFLKRNNIRCVPRHRLCEDTFFIYQLILKSQACTLMSDITYLQHRREDSATAYNIRYFKSKYAQDVAEIVSLQKDNAQQYKKYTFYTQMIIRISIYARGYAFRIYRSKIIPRHEKKIYLANMLKYPVSLKEIMRMNQKLHHLLLYLISNIPFMGLNIFLGRLARAFESLFENKERR